MKKLLFIILALFLVDASFGQTGTRSQMIGANLAPINPRLAIEPQKQVNRDILKDLPRGSTLRWQSLFWEAFPTTNPIDFRPAGIDANIELLNQSGVKGLCLLSPTPWQPHPGDWWMPTRDKWATIKECLLVMIRHIEAKAPGTLYQLANEPKGKAYDPDSAEKPGGSNRTEHGEWHSDFKDFCSMILDALNECGVNRGRIVSPAISTIGEGGSSGQCELDEVFSFLEMKSVLSRCGVISFHLLPRANFADADRPVSFWLDRWFRRTERVVKLLVRSDQRVICTEVYAPYGQSNLPFGDPRIADTWRLIIGHMRKRNWGLTTWNFSDNPGDRYHDYKTFPVAWYKTPPTTN
jgi:hypothetical protein